VDAVRRFARSDSPPARGSVKGRGVGDHGDHNDESAEGGRTVETASPTAQESIDDRPWRAESGSRISQVDLSLLQRLYASIGPARPGSEVIGADLIRSLSPADLSIRDDRVARVFEYDAGPFTVVLEVAVDDRQRRLIQGHVLHAQADRFADARIIMDPGQGVVRVGLLSAEGEFRMDDLGPGVYRMVILTGRGRIVVEHLTIR
jgi:hypothetical protein